MSDSELEDLEGLKDSMETGALVMTRTVQKEKERLNLLNKHIVLQLASLQAKASHTHAYHTHINIAVQVSYTGSLCLVKHFTYL